MTEKPVNLNRFRKAKARAEKKARADQNVAQFGRSKTERDQSATRIMTSDRFLDGHRVSLKHEDK